MRVQRGALTNGQSVRTKAPRIRIDDAGLNHLTEEWETDASNLMARIPKINQPHPQFTQLVCKEVNPEFLRNGLGRWTAVFRGLVWLPGEPLPPDQISIESVASQEDIRSHPDFASLVTLGGSDVVLDEDGLFVGFKGPAQLAGVQSFFAPSVVFSRRRFTTSIPNGGQTVGKINNPGNNLANAQTSGSQNWLKMAFTSEQYGGVWQTYESWLRSGTNGWSAAIYG